jgi:DNA-binding transcriptional LysR family regulator
MALKSLSAKCMSSISHIPQLHELRERLHLLPALAALLEHRSVTAAGNQLNVSQPAMSRILGQLRSIFNDPLLVRVGGDMVLTPRAQAMREPLADLVTAANDLFHNVPFHPETASRTFRAVIPDVLAAYLMPGMLNAMSKHAPGCRLNLLPWRAARPDIVITTDVEAYPLMRMVPIYQDHDVLASRTALPTDVDPLDLDHVAVVATGAAEDPVDRWLADQGRSRHVVTIVSTYLLALHLVARSGLHAILPSRLLSEVGPSFGVRPTELQIHQTPDQIHLLYPRIDEADPGARWFREFVRGFCATQSEAQSTVDHGPVGTTSAGE